MNMRMVLLLIHFFLLACTNGKPQQQTDQLIGGPCEGCEAIYESPVPFEQLTSAYKLPQHDTSSSKLRVYGTVYRQDGYTPAPGVVLYFYHTNREGVYPTTGNEKGWGRRHGYLRGWVKTDAQGQYEFYTIRPAAYPSRSDPAHIHITVKEPDINEYYIDDILFDSDPLLTASYRIRLSQKGGTGVVSTAPSAGMEQAKRDIILGMNIENYPSRK